MSSRSSGCMSAIVSLQIDVAERDVTRLVAQHVLGEVAQQRTGGLAAHVVERRERETFDDHVHADQDLREVVGRERASMSSFSHGEIG